MTDNNGIRSGSLQFYPRVRAKKVVPSVNWKPVSKEGVGFMGFVGYKVGMISALVKDDTEHSMTKTKRIVVPATILECPVMKIYSVRFYKNGKVMKDIVVSNGKDLKKSVKVAKKVGEFKDVEDFDDVRVIMYSGVKDTCVDKNKADNTIKSFKPVFPGMPVVLMAQDPLGNPSYYGRKDISEFLSNKSLEDIPWKDYSY